MPVIIVAGASPAGISSATAEKFAANGFSVSLLARTQSKLDSLASDLAAKYPKVQVKGYATDLTDEKAIAASVEKTRKDLGHVTALLWNPYGPAASLLKGTTKDFADALALAVNNLVFTVQLLLPDLEANKGFVAVTGGGLALENDGSVETGNNWGVANLAVAKAAQRKLVHMMNRELIKKDIYVVELTVCGVVQGTAFDPESKGPITKEQCADAYWDLYQKRDYKTWHQIQN